MLMAPHPKHDGFTGKVGMIKQLPVHAVHHRCIVHQDLHYGVLQNREECYAGQPDGPPFQDIYVISDNPRDHVPCICRWFGSAPQRACETSVISVFIRNGAENGTPFRIFTQSHHHKLSQDSLAYVMTACTFVTCSLGVQVAFGLSLQDLILYHLSTRET